MPRIQANRDTIDDRFSVLGFTVRTESPLFEVAVATDPNLFKAENRSRRARANFFSSRAQGVTRARRGEAVYLVPPDVLNHFIGQPRLYFGLATYRENSRGTPDFVQAPTDGSMYVAIGQLTERGLRRSAVALSGSSYGQNGPRDPSLDWGGDAERDAGRAAASAPTAARGATAPAPGQVPAAAPAVAVAADYDDGFGLFSEPEIVSRPLDLLLRDYNGGLLEQLRFFGESLQWFAGVPNTREFPHSAICQVFDPTRGAEAEQGTAFYIGRNLLLTAAHVVVGKSSLVFVPGKNGQGVDAAHEPFGRFTVAAAQWRAHDRYVASNRDFDFAIVKTPNPAPGGRWFNLLEELRESRAEGVAVCGYSVRSRQSDIVSRLVSRAIDSRKQHLHAGAVRTVENETFSYDIQTLPGNSGSPVYWIEAGATPRAHLVGVHVAGDDNVTNKGCRLTDAKIAWIRARAAEWGQASAMELDDEVLDADAALSQPLEVVRSTNGDLASQIRWFAETVMWVAGVSDTSRVPHSAICQVLIYNGERALGAATAFYIGRNLLMTNAHVVNGATRLVVIPGKNGAGTATAQEPFGRFSVDLTPATSRPHPSYNRGRDFDMAIVKAPRAAPNGRWLTPIEELRESRPEGVAVCGYSAQSRRTDLVGTVVNATLNPDKQHLHRGFVRSITDDSFAYDVQELAGSSGSPVYWIEGGVNPRVHVVGVNAGPRDATTNEGCRLTDAKVNWIRGIATEWGQAAAMALDGDGVDDALAAASASNPDAGAAAQTVELAAHRTTSPDPGGEVPLAAPPLALIQQPLETDPVARAQAVPVVVPIAAAVIGAVFTRLLSNAGDVAWELDQMSGLKHPNDQAPNPLPPFQDAPAIRLTDWPYSGRGDNISAGFEIRWQYNGQSLGNVQISNVTANDAIGWGLTVKARIMNDSIVYPRAHPQFAALRVRLEYRFTRIWPLSDQLAYREVHLFGNGRHNLTGDWTQNSLF